MFRSLLFEHMTFHSSSRLYSCDQCHKRFKQKHYLNKHRKTCNSKSMLDNDDSGPSDISKLKYHVLSTTSKAKPLEVDSEEEDGGTISSEERNNPIPLTSSQEKRLDLISNDSDDYLDKSYLKLLKRVGLVKYN